MKLSKIVLDYHRFENNPTEQEDHWEIRGNVFCFRHTVVVHIWNNPKPLLSTSKTGLNDASEINIEEKL